MKLIDKEALLLALKRKRYSKQSLDLIESQPVVDAIPVDKPFLKMRYGDYVVYNKKWLIDHLQTEWDILQGKEYQPSIPVEWLKKWEEENETNRH